MGIFRIIFIIIAIYWIGNFIRKYLIIYFNNVAEINQRQKQHATTVTYTQKKKGRINTSDGEYIEFEESN